MTPLAQRDQHGLSRWFYHEASDRQAATLHTLFADGRVPCRLDAAGVRAHLGLRPLDETTCFADVKAVRPGSALFRRGGRWIQERVPLLPSEGDLLDLLAGALEGALGAGDATPPPSPKATPPPNPLPEAERGGRNIDEGRGASPSHRQSNSPSPLRGGGWGEGSLRSETALALGGGLDSALLLAIVRRVLGRSVPVISLCPRVAGYSERAAILSTARDLGIEPEFIQADERDFAEALSDCVRFAEVPLYNLHPVSKLLLARALKERGICRVITGDGADQVFAGVPGSDYLPIVGALFAGAGVGLCCPFLDPHVAAWGTKRADPAKSALRQAARRLLPAATADAPKVAQLAPEMDLSGVATPQELELAGRALPLSPSDVRAVSLALLFRHFPRLGE